MTKEEKQHLIDCLKRIVASKLVKPETAEPDLHAAFKAELDKGRKLRFRPCEEVARRLSREGVTYNIRFEHVFREPAAYVRARKRYQREFDLCRRKNAPMLERLRKLQDLILVGEVKNVAETIKAVEGWKP